MSQMPPLMRAVPTSVDSERLHLRKPQAGDGHAVYEAIVRSLAELRPWLDFSRTTPTRVETEKRVRLEESRFLLRETLPYYIYRKKEQTFVGQATLIPIKWEIPSFEMQYWLDTAASGNGYMTEAIQKLIEIAEKDLRARRLEIRVAIENEKSRRIPETLGFALEGILKNADNGPDGILYDMALYARVRKNESSRF